MINDQLPENLLCFSHLRWDFVVQRPQHLMNRFSRFLTVYFFEEPVFTTGGECYIAYEQKQPDLWICVPHLPESRNQEEIDALQMFLLHDFFTNKRQEDFIFWYYTPMALGFSRSFDPKLVVYDCMDELSTFRFAPPTLKSEERKLFQRADIVFTGGYSLYEAKRNDHSNIHPFPSSIDKAHFEKARNSNAEPVSQSVIPGPKIGYYGVIDERFDADLIREIAEKRPGWQIILIGPIVKIDPETLPRRNNIHYLGSREYNDLPLFLSGWDVALIPFLINESTHFLSPTKTPEYLAAGRPVVSTPIRDVIFHYGSNGLIDIAGDSDDFIAAIESKIRPYDRQEWLQRVDRFLSDNSWDKTFYGMRSLLISAAGDKNDARADAVLHSVKTIEILNAAPS